MNVSGSSDSVAASPEQTGGLQHGDQQESIKTDRMASNPCLPCMKSLHNKQKSCIQNLASSRYQLYVRYENKQTHLELDKRKVPVRFLPLYLVVFQSMGGCILLLQTSRLSF